MSEIDPYVGIAEAVEKRRREIEGTSERIRENGRHLDIAEAVRKRREEIEGTYSETSERSREETIQATFRPPREEPQTSTEAEMTAWQGAWLLIFTFFFAVTLLVTGLTLLFGGPSPLSTYGLFWAILVLLIIIYPIAQIVDRWASRR